MSVDDNRNGGQPDAELTSTQFAILPEWILFHRDLTSSAKLAYAFLDRRAAAKERSLFPSAGDLGERMGVTERAARGYMRELVKVGALVKLRRRWNASTVYRLLRDPPAEQPQLVNEEPSERKISSAYRRNSASALDGTTVPSEREPLNESQLTRATSLAPATPKRAKADPEWEALMATCDVREPITAGARKAYNRALKELREVGATPEEITERGGRFRRRWPDVSLTPTALARRWSELAVEPKRGRPAPSAPGQESINEARRRLDDYRSGRGAASDDASDLASAATRGGGDRMVLDVGEARLRSHDGGDRAPSG